VITKARPAEHAPINWHIKRATTAWAFFAFLACFAACAYSFAGLDVKSSYQPGEPIVVKMALEGKPEGAVLRKDKFKVPGANVVKVDDTTWHIWALPGKYNIEAFGEWRLYGEIEGKDGKFYKYIQDEDDYEFTASFEVTGGVTPPPPDPANPYKPAPQYQAAVEPVRVLSLVKADSRALATLYSSIASQVRAGSFKNLGEIRAELVTKGKSLNLSGKYAGLAPAVDKYLSSTVGLEQVAPAATVGDVFETLAWAVFEAGKV
jgi:hypothetical protein